jgi:hypothetical protein
LGHLVKINYEDKKLFIEYLSERLTILSDSYVTHPISQMSFSYIIKTGKCLDENRTLLLQDYSDKNLTVHNFNNMNLPITMEPSKYGEIRISNTIDNGETIIRYMVVNGDKTYQIDVCNNGMVNKVTILGKINLSWIDTKINLDDSSFKREIGKSTLYFLDGEIFLQKLQLNAKSFKRFRHHKKPNK